MRKYLCACFLLVTVSGCLDYSSIGKPRDKATPGVDGTKKPVSSDEIVASDFFEAFAKSAEQGVFKDTDQYLTTQKKVSAQVGFKIADYQEQLNTTVGDMTKNERLDKEDDRKDLAARLRRVATAVKK